MNKLRVGLTLGALALGAAALAPMAVRAGYVKQDQVWHYHIVSVKGSSGSVTGARNSGDDLQWIGCTVSRTPTAITGTCSARDSKALVNSCTTNDILMITVMESVGPASQIDFSYDDKARCVAVSVTNNSFVLY
jgi:hypothetical protein